ncbi:nucleoside hydrolase 3-like isoform X2 [Malus domestica]
MNNPHLKKNIEHIYVMGGGVRSKNPTGCCPENSTSCVPRQCGDPGNVFTDYTSNPYAEFNFLGDPFAAYQVIHSGIPVTLVPLDATNTIPISQNFFEALEKSQNTYEAQYVFQSLKMACDTWFDKQFYTSYFMWDSFTAGVAVSIMRNNLNNPNGENEFAEMEYMNITVITSNEPYGVTDGSNPFFDGLKVPKFNLDKNGVHSGHVQKGLRDPFCIGENGKGKCRDGYTDEVTGSEAVSVLVATKAKPNQDPQSPLNREFFVSFLEVLNNPKQKGRFNLTTQFPFYKEVTYKPEFGNKKLGKPVVFDMDMSAGDFAALFYLLKVPIQVINLKAIIVSPTGWANAATIDVIYDLLHMMGRDDIPVGLGDVFATNQSDPIFPAVGGCKYQQAIPHGNGGLLDSDTLYGLARDLPRSLRRYTTENSLEHGAPKDTDHPELRQPLALEVCETLVKTLEPGSKITILTNGPLTNLAKMISSKKNTVSLIQDVYIVGGHISSNDKDKGNVFTIPSNEYAEFNMFLDPLAAKAVFESSLNITLIPLGIQREVGSFSKILERMRRKKKTPEALFVRRLLSRLYRLQQLHHRYHHMQTFLGEILGAVLLAGDSRLNQTFQAKPINVYAEGVESRDGQLLIDENQRKLVRVLDSVNPQAYYNLFVDRLSDSNQSAILGSFEEQVKFWRKPPNQTETAA